MGIARKIKHIATWKSLLFFFVLYIVMFAVNNGTFEKLTSDTGVQLLDTRFGYTSEEAYQAITDLGAEGRAAYSSALKTDCVFPLTYMAFLVFLIGFLLRRLEKNDGAWNLLLCFPVAAMVFDWIENGMIFTMIRAFPQEAVWAETLGSTATIVKLLFSAASLLAAAGIAIYGFLRKKHG